MKHKLGLTGHHVLIGYTLMGLLLLIDGCFLFYKLGTVPHIFIDESALANEVQSLADYGQDTHGYSWPLYFQGPFGGQSILYSFFVVPVVKLFGFSIAAFRAPFVIITLLLILSISLLVRKLAQHFAASLLVELTLITAPWLFISTRWVLDCNIAPIMVIFGIEGLMLAFRAQTKKWRLSWLLLGTAFIAIAAYGYSVAWLYLPVFLLILAIYTFVKKLLTWQELGMALVLTVLLVLPLVIFAIDTNIYHITTAKHFLWWTLPPYSNNRNVSFIDFHAPNIVDIAIANLGAGIQQYIKGSDGLAWNSLAPYGVIYPALLLLLPVGIFAYHQADSRLNIFRNLVVISLVSFVPLMLIVKPNYNHWNFINLPLMILVGLGFWYSYQFIRVWLVRAAIVLLPVVLGLLFVHAYYGSANMPTYFTAGVQNNYLQASYQNIDQINQFIKQHPNRYLYVSQLSSTFTYFKTVAIVSPAEDAKISDTPAGFQPKLKYGALRDLSQFKTIRKRDYALLPYANVNSAPIGTTFTFQNMEQDKFKVVKVTPYLSAPNAIVQRIK